MRLVSLCPSLTELVFELGLGEDLVGITEYCVRPADRVHRIEKVGGTKDPCVRRICELRPDLVLLNEEENRLEDAEALEACGIPHLVTFPRSIEETAESVRKVGAALGAQRRAEILACGIEGTLARMHAERNGAPPVRFAYLIWRKPWMTVGEDTYVSHLLTAAGGENVVGPCPARYPAIDPAQLAQARPDAVLLSSEPFPFQPKHVAELCAATGLEPSRFRIVDGELLSWHGARTAQGLEYASRVLGDLGRGPRAQRAV